MATAQEIIAKAISQEGVSEKNANNYIEKYHKDYYDSATSAPWCCIFVWWIFKECNASDLFCDGNKIASCAEVSKYYNSNQKIKDNPQAGDLILFDNNNNNSPEHIGIVIEVKTSGGLVTIEGNYSNKVAKINRSASEAWQFIRPNYSSSPALTSGNITTVSNTYNIPNFQNATKMWNYFIGTGLSENAVAGLMGNIWHESLFDPGNKQSVDTDADKRYTNGINDGSITRYSFAHDGAGYGLAQWTYYSRKEQLYDYAKQNTSPFNIGNLDMQLNYLLYDLKNYKVTGSSTPAFTYLSQSGISVEQACKYVLDYYENPGVRAESTRLSNAEKIYNTFHGHRNVSGGSQQNIQVIPEITITKHSGAKDCTSSKNRTIKYIVVHYTTSTHSRSGKALETCKGWDTDGKSGSADFVVDDSNVVQYSPDINNYYCWHCGDEGLSNSGGGSFRNICKNSNSIGIELCSSTYSGKWYKYSENQTDWYFTDAVLTLGAKLIKKLMMEYNISIDNVIRHYDVSGKICPGLVGWNKYNGNTEEKWLAFKQKANSMTNASSSANGYIAKVIKSSDTYNSASETSTKVGKIIEGQTVVVRQLNEGWAFTEKGWVKADCLEISSDIASMNNYLATYWNEVVYYADGTYYAPVRRVGVNGEQIQFFDDILKTSFDSRQRIEETFTFDVYVTNNELALQWLESFEKAQGDKNVFLEDVKEGLLTTLDNKKKLIASPKKPSITVEVKGNAALDINENEIIKKLENEKHNIVKYYRQDYNPVGWNKIIEESPQGLNFWFDFLDTQGELGQYNVQSIGNRPKAVNDDKIKSIYFQETPTVLFLNPEQYAEYAKEPWRYKDLTGYTIVRIQPFMENYFTISSQGKSAKDELDSLLYQHTYAAETATLTTLPIYHLQPNTRVFVKDDNTGIHGEYIISRITIPLQYNGTSSITTTKAVERIY